MNEISETLSDAIFTICNKIISKAKYDKTYKCRIVEKVSDGKYLIMKDSVTHVVSGSSTYEVDQVVRVLLPQNNWSDAFIIYP